MKDLSHLSKTDIRFWQNAVFRQPYTKGSKRWLTKEWYARIQFRGKRQFFSLGTPNKAAAAAKARDIYLSLMASGWEITLRRYKPSSAVPKKLPSDGGTVGDFLAELKEKSDAKPKTLEGYAAALRKIVADIIGQGHGRGGGATRRTAWRQAVECINLRELTPAKVQQWKLSFVANAGDDPVRQRAARISANSFLRRAKSLFALRMTKHLERVALPTPLPFEGVEFYNRTSMRYHSSFDVLKLIRAAKKELAPSAPEQFKVFLLAVMAGLRRREIDTLEWTAFRWDSRMIRVEPTKWFHPKSEDSIGDVEIDPELVDVFRKCRVKAKSPFVIASKVKPRLDAKWEHYRCTSIFENLIEWLRIKGVTTKTPLHTLRKEFGSIIAAEHGIYAASRLLRHADITTTAQCYLDKKKRVTSGLGGLLTDGKRKAKTKRQRAKFQGNRQQ
jgi:integrase